MFYVTNLLNLPPYHADNNHRTQKPFVFFEPYVAFKNIRRKVEIKDEDEGLMKINVQQSIRNSHPTLPTSQVEESLESRRYRQ